jgi:hypothetical protein
MDRQPVPHPTHTSLSEVTDALAETGASGQFLARPGAQVRCLTCGQDFSASRLSADQVTRLEGASDPADSAIVVPVVCPRCDAAGALTLQFGPLASLEESAVLGAMQRTPREGSDPPPTAGS